MVQPIWSGFLRLSLISFQVRLAPATRPSVRSRLCRLNAATGKPLIQDFVDPRSGVAVPRASCVLGFEYAEGRYVAIGEDELKAIEPPASDIIDIDTFVHSDSIDRLYIDASYYLHPNGSLAAEAVSAIRLAMMRKGQAGIGRMRLTDRDHFVLIEPRSAGLLLSTLRYADTVEPAEFSETAEADVPAEMIEIAEGMIARRSGVFDPAQFRDAYGDAIRELLADKVKSQPQVAEPARPAEPDEPASTDERADEPAEATGAQLPDASPDSAAPDPAIAATGVAAEPENAPDVATTVDAIIERLVAVESAGASAEERLVNGADAEAAETRAADADVLLQVTDFGERRYSGSGWAGSPGGRESIEAISIRPPAGWPAAALEFRVFAPEGRATPWATGGNYAGSWGRRLALTGFAVRPAEEQRDRIEVVYEGCFFEAGVVGPKRDGERCVSPIPDDRLEAILVRVRERAA
jgi:DNA end-binding protein Ku